MTARRAASADVAIVGAGVIGLSVAWHLAGLGLHVIVVDRRGVAAGASGVQPGGVRCQWGKHLNCLLALESLAFYRDLGARLGTRLRPRFTACGYAFVAHTDLRLRELEDAVRLQRELGIPSQLLTPAETAAAVPGLDPAAIRGAAWCGDDGYFDRGQEPVEAFAEAARARGVAFATAEVAALEPDGGGWRVRDTRGDGIRSERVVVAAGCDTRTILHSVGVDLPIAPEPRHLFLSDPIRERLLEPLVVATELGLAAKHLADGRVLASDLRAEGDPARDARRWRRAVRTGIEALLPRLALVDYRHLVSGVYDVTPDHDPILAELPGAPGVWAAAGFSGHGFMIAPAVGRAMADAVAGRPAAHWLSDLSSERFEGRTSDVETQIV